MCVCICVLDLYIYLIYETQNPKQSEAPPPGVTVAKLINLFETNILNY